MVGAENTKYTPLSQCALHFKQAIIISEDRNFYKHQGIDIPSVGLALVTNLATKDYKRGRYYYHAAGQEFIATPKRSILKKIEEVLLAWLVEDIFRIGKDRILEIYLNIIEFAPGIYGIENAANHYFSNAASELSLTESLISLMWCQGLSILYRPSTTVPDPGRKPREAPGDHDGRDVQQGPYYKRGH